MANFSIKRFIILFVFIVYPFKIENQVLFIFFCLFSVDSLLYFYWLCLILNSSNFTDY